MLWTIVKKNRTVVLAVYILHVVENVTFLLRPLLLGQAVQELVFSRYPGQGCLSAVGNEVLFVSVCAFRKFVDTWVFAPMTTELAECIAKDGLARGKDPSTIQGQTFLARDLTVILEGTLPDVLKESLTLGFSLGALAFFNWALLPLNLLMLGVGWFVVPRVQAAVSALADKRNALLEKDAEVFARRDHSAVVDHLAAYCRISIQWSNAEAGGYAALDVAGSVLVFASVGLIVCMGGDFAAAFAVHRYAANVVGNIQKMNLLLTEREKAENVLKRVAAKDE